VRACDTVPDELTHFRSRYNPAPSAEELKMAKPKPKEIDAADLLEYLASESDFAFETSVVKEFRTRSTFSTAAPTSTP
jgi:hypothetical protein